MTWKTYTCTCNCVCNCNRNWLMPDCVCCISQCGRRRNVRSSRTTNSSTCSSSNVLSVKSEMINHCFYLKACTLSLIFALKHVQHYWHKSVGSYNQIFAADNLLTDCIYNFHVYCNIIIIIFSTCPAQSQQVLSKVYAGLWLQRRSDVTSELAKVARKEIAFPLCRTTVSRWKSGTWSPCRGGPTPGPGRSYALPLKNWDLAVGSACEILIKYTVTA